MTSNLRPLIAANWKMHGDLSWADRPLEFNTHYAQEERAHLDVLICPPAILLPRMSRTAVQAGVELGAQDCHANADGAHTGQLSTEMLHGAGADYVIVGHSECRAAGDSNKDVNAKAKAARRGKLIPIICVGETKAQREKGDALKTVAAQIKASVPKLAEYVIAYEPVWAIGTGLVAEPEDIAEVHDAIREQVGPDVRILYGGSVKPRNAKAILALKNVNGALIGGAGLDMESLAEIAKRAPKPAA